MLAILSARHPTAPTEAAPSPAPIFPQAARAAIGLLAGAPSASTRKRPHEGHDIDRRPRKRPRRDAPRDRTAGEPALPPAAGESELEPLHPDFLGHGDPGGSNEPYFPRRPPAHAELLAKEAAGGSYLLTFDATRNDFSKGFVGMHATACHGAITRHFTVVSGRDGRCDPRFPGRVVFDLLVRPRGKPDVSVADCLLSMVIGDTMRFLTPCTTAFRGVRKDIPVVRCVVGSGMGPLHADLETRLQTQGRSAPVIGCVQMRNSATRHIYDRIKAQYADPRLAGGRLYGIYSGGEALDGRQPGRLDALLRDAEVARAVIAALLLPHSHFYASGIDSIPDTVEATLAGMAEGPEQQRRLQDAIARKKAGGRWHSEGTPDTLRLQATTQGE